MTEKREVNKFNFKFENTYIDLPNSFYSEINLSPVIRPELIVFNKSLGNSLGLNSEELKSKEGLEILAGNKKIENGEYIAQAYGGHQFGHFNMLGDGRALLIGEQKTNELLNITGKPSDKFDIQLKGSGRTPYSRGGDGRAVLGPMLREYIISEAMYNLGIPTTRSLAVIKTNEKVYREYVKKGAILTRVATSHLRFGTLEYAANFLGKDSVKKLADYAIDRHYSHIKNNKGILTGTPIRDVLYKGSKEKGLEFAHLDGTKPVMLIMGGSQGSVKINTSIRALLPELLKKYDIIHLCGKGNVDESLKDTKGYVQYDYLSKELPDIFAASDFVITRAGSNAICEFLALNKPMLLIPLSKRASRGDQILNAESFKKQGFADVCDEDEMTEESLFNSINALYENREKYITTMKSASLSKGVDEVMAVIKSVSK